MNDTVLTVCTVIGGAAFFTGFGIWLDYWNVKQKDSIHYKLKNEYEVLKDKFDALTKTYDELNTREYSVEDALDMIIDLDDKNPKCGKIAKRMAEVARKVRGDDSV